MKREKLYRIVTDKIIQKLEENKIGEIEREQDGTILLGGESEFHFTITGRMPRIDLEVFFPTLTLMSDGVSVIQRIESYDCILDEIDKFVESAIHVIKVLNLHPEMDI